MKEIGGYFELENFIQKEYYKDLLSFSSARNCLLYIIKKRAIQKIFLPIFLCDVVSDTCTFLGIQVEFYSIDKNFVPIIDKKHITSTSYLYIVNFYGLLQKAEIEVLYQKYQYIILDNTHNFFQEPIPHMDTIYNCRKYFGVPDGAYLSTDLEKDNQIKEGKSAHRFRHLIGRYEQSASDFYQDFKKADESFDQEELCYMSKLTKNLLGAIDYSNIYDRRIANYHYLKKKLLKYNELDLQDKELNYMYPFLSQYGEKLREILIKNKVYIPVLWPNVLETSNKDSIEYTYANNILPLPIDQRYDKKDMDRIISIIEEFYTNLP